MFKSYKTFVNEAENYNKIKEKFPIKCKISRKSPGNYKFEFEPMTISYDTYIDITSSTDTGFSSYDYDDGSAVFTIKFDEEYEYTTIESFKKQFGSKLQNVKKYKFTYE